MNRTFSIIIPVYNSERTLRRCVDSVLLQSYQNFELLLIDDGSLDGSGKICDEYQNKDSRVKVVHKENGGPGSARNKGIELCTGNYIWFVDSDDWIEKESLGIFYSHLADNDCDILFFGLVEEPSKKKKESLISLHQQFYRGKRECANVINELEQDGLFGWSCNKVYRRDLIVNHCLNFSTRFSIQEDHIFSLEYILNVNVIKVIPVYPYHYEFLQSNTLINKKYPYDLTKERNLVMLKKRLALLKLFDFSNTTYNEWFMSDYLTREVANLRRMRIEKYSLNERIKEIDRVKSILNRNKGITSDTIKKYKMISFLPSMIQAILI